MIALDYIEVCVTLPVRGTFVYALPEHLKNLARIGMRVLVPFGRRRVTGYIMGGQADSGPFEAKPVLEILDEAPLFPESDLPFFKWVADYYLHPLGETVKTALPAGIEQKDVSCATLTAAGQRAMAAGNLDPEVTALLDAVARHRAPTLKSLTGKDRQRGNLLRQMEKKGLVCITSVLKKEAAAVKREKFIRPSGQVPDSGIRMSRKRYQILSLLKEKGELSLTGLRQHVPTAPRLIGPLEAAGYICIEEREVFRDPLGDPVEPDTPPELTRAQARAVEAVCQSWEKGFSPYLLTGVTGSGKTEVYLRLVSEAVDRGLGVLVLVPEIALISQTERRFRARFGERISVLHSMLSQGERLDQWRRIASGQVRIVIGARSAIFAPLEKIGIVVVDEEHDPSYKQETGLRYNARDLAVVRAKMHDCPVVLGSATPSIQSYENVVRGRFRELKLEKRVNRHPLPEITLVDLKRYKDARGTDRIITPELGRAIRACLDKGNQALIFLNRRGFASFPACSACGKTLECPHCSVTMTFHRGAGLYKCHLCGHARPQKVVCPHCGADKIRDLGFGTEKIESMLKAMFPDARLARMDQDATARKGSALALLRQIRNRTVDIIVGTQMLAKGHDFPSITLVGVICADLSLNLPDFRASERTFQLLAQVAGRAGRGQEAGRVIMQTYNPDHFTIEASRSQDFLEFYNHEAPFRKALMYPPFARMVQLKISGKDLERTREQAFVAAKVLSRILGPQKGVQILGPIEAAIARIANRYRWQILIKSPSASLLNQAVGAMVSDPEILKIKDVTIAVDVDPYFLM